MKILRLFISILLIPICVIVTLSFYNGIFSIKDVSKTGVYFILGALLYSVIHLLLFRLDFLYVFGHECMHAFATFCSGGKASNMKVSGKEGSVKTTTPNFFVILAPYLLPVYTILVAIVYFILSFSINVTAYSGIFIFLIGFTLMFHLAYTAESMRDKQSDLVKAGYLSSISFIYIVNLIIVFLIISLLFREVSFIDFISRVYVKTKFFYYSFWKQLFL
ncbi:MAG: hypothetical protein CO035_06245 [Candidatus Omnitrophica bacterium CG_4_9_14_0_2_um_filter_42_8]|nr:MAG: hypothetical protein COW92_05685 [Candidatus Omnitrophica bacterium CG22_combo_CG10-13_8_21_14_all_43_16]PJC47457.1 MAG: hypothetical protein CO035_06245 [Candidatus Omnitrophica bacterium CG_4_9_14_0_2_um_filter_42_8]